MHLLANTLLLLTNVDKNEECLHQFLLLLYFVVNVTVPCSMLLVKQAWQARRDAFPARRPITLNKNHAPSLETLTCSTVSPYLTFYVLARLKR